MAERLFGTNGVRGVVNEEMTVQMAMEVGQAIGTFMTGKVALATDSRTSADMLRCAVSAGLMASGAEVLDLGMLPTPALQYYVKNSGVKGGVMITASHNPPEFNGIKCVDHDGTEMPRNKEEQIEKFYFTKTFAHKTWRSVGSIRPVNGVGQSYAGAVKRQVDFAIIQDAKMTVVMDCANGAGSVTSPWLLDQLGVRAITLNANPQGTFPGHESEPTPEHLKDLVATVKATGADLGVAHDGDADRTIFVDDKGTYLYGDKSLALVASYIVKEAGGGKVVTPVSTSSCVEDVVKKAGGEIIYTKVGSPIVARKMMEVGAIFGGEENGGLIFPEHQYCRDGAMTMAKVIEIVAKEGKLSKLMAQVPSYALDKRKLDCRNDIKEEVLEDLVVRFQDRRTDTTDGVKVFFDNGWALVRPSGTEPIFRVYSEGMTKDAAKKIGDTCEKELREAIAEAMARK
ncbi:MAG: putative phosphoglucosamine mutase [Methanomassiliicoccales archaeon PtaU1.Bin124]|nr:MAG: putative phosphoglucosamine mutase [Methanomassiliicoccales archaeon PtaU1.Bin124]